MSDWYALQNIEDAAKRTRELLLPFDWRLWARIAVMAFFVGGVAFPGATTGGDFSSEQDFDMAQYQGSDFFDFTASSMEFNGFSLNMLVLAAVIASLGLALLFGVLRAVFGFVYYQSLLDDNVRIRRNFRKHFVNGLKLFAFEIVAVLLFMLAGALLILPLFVTLFSLIITVPLAILLVLAALVFFQFTSDFIPLFVIEREQGILASWQDLYQIIIDEWRQLGLYFVVKTVIGVMVQIAVATASLVFGLLLVLPVGLVAFALYLLFKPLALLAVLIGLMVWIGGIVYFLNGPVTTFFRYYGLMVYNDLTQVENIEN